ncbi:MAG: hypothetical protein Q9161_002517 [Pseudevernia consocians]
MMEPEHTTPLHTYPITLDEIDPQHLKPCKGGEFSIELHSKIIERSKENAAARDGDRDNNQNPAHPPPQSSHDVAKTMDILGTNTAGPWYGWPQEAPMFGNDASTLMFDQDFTNSGPSRKSSTNNFHSPPESETSQKAKKQRGHTPNNTPNTATTSSRNSSAATPFEGTKDTNTTRFQTILDTVQAVGFENFDAAVSGYYTHTFEKNSAADLAQKTSRARRLAGVMTSLHESSATWTLWEARGYRHQVVEAAESIYSSEVTRLANSRKRKRGHSLEPGRDSRSSSEFEVSSSEFESSAPSTASSRSRQGSGNPRSSLGELQRVYQNK